ncbi:MAG: heavy metal translocating P-type ATPase, partial [Thermodesulfobacteriota bacterium]
AALLLGTTFTNIAFPHWLILGLYLVCYLTVGGDILRAAVSNIGKWEFFDEFFLMSVATIGAFFIGAYPEAVAVMLFFKVGEMFQDKAVSRSRDSIGLLLAIRPDFALVERDRETRVVSPESVETGEIIQIKPGERIPLDGYIQSGESFVDTSPLTGEPEPKKVRPGERAFSGTINQSGLLRVEVDRPFYMSTVSRILDLVENAADKKARTDQFITKFARYYTPLVVGIAAGISVLPVVLHSVLIPASWYSQIPTFSDWIYRGLIFLVISCPCALVVSIPLGFFAGVGKASKQGILVKGANFLEALSNLKMVIWDKTGTLTRGTFKVQEIEGKNGFSGDDVLAAAAHVEIFSNHPIARSILERYQKSVNKDAVLDYQELAGYGVKAVVRGQNIIAGNERILHSLALEFESPREEDTVVHVVIDDVHAGYLVIRDELKASSRHAVEQLRKRGVEKHYMLTGDREDVARNISGQLNLDDFSSGLLPQDKVSGFESFFTADKKRKGYIAYVGDGINDAPVLTRADIGIAMGGLGSDAAIDSADVVLMEDDPEKLVQAVDISRRTKFIVWENIVFALGVKGLFLAMGAMGSISMWEAVFADVGVALIAVLNSIRILR